MNYYVKFVIGNVAFAVPIEEVREIARPKSVQKEEKIPKNICGFFVFRKRMMVLYDLPSFLKMESKNQFEVIITEVNRKLVGFKVDKVCGVISAETLAPFPELVMAKSYLRGIVKEDENLIQVLSLRRLLTGARLTNIEKCLRL